MALIKLVVGLIGTLLSLVFLVELGGDRFHLAGSDDAPRGLRWTSEEDLM